MNHPVTIGEISLFIGALGVLPVAGLGLLEVLAGGMSDDPEAGDHDARAGCIVFILASLVCIGCVVGLLA